LGQHDNHARNNDMGGGEIMTVKQITKYHHHGLDNPTTKAVLIALNRHTEKTPINIWRMFNYAGVFAPSPETIGRILRTLRSADLAQSSWIHGIKSTYVGYKLTTKGKKAQLVMRGNCE